MFPFLLFLLVFATTKAVDMARAHRIDSLSAELQPRARRLLELAAAEGIELVVTEGRRTVERQRELYAQGRTTPGPIVTWTMNSKHLTGEAFDVAVRVDGKLTWPDDDALWERIGQIGESVGLRWGGRWEQRDRPHFEA